MFFFKQKKAYMLGTGHGSSDFCSSDFPRGGCQGFGFFFFAVVAAVVAVVVVVVAVVVVVDRKSVV